MDPFHELTLHHTYLYRAPANHYPEPREIAQGTLTIEILVAGAVYAQPSPSDKQEHRFGRGSIFCHFPGGKTIHKSDLSDPYQCMSMQFNASPKVKSLLPHIAHWSDDETLDAFVHEQLKSFYARPDDRHRLAHRILGELMWQSRDSTSGTTTNALPAIVTRSLEIIEAQFLLLHSLTDLAKHVDTSTPTLHRLFRQSGQLSPWELIRQRKLREARYLLTGTFLSIKEVAFQSGFQSFEHFCRAFREETGTSPRAFRNAARSGNSISA